jgi:hypothetical protein
LLKVALNTISQTKPSIRKLNEFKLATLELIGTDCTGSCKSNYHMIKTTTVPEFLMEYNYFTKGGVLGPKSKWSYEVLQSLGIHCHCL